MVRYVLDYLKEGDKYSMPVELRRKYEHAFKESNEWVRSEYFPTRRALFEAANVPPARESYFHSNELDQLSRLICAIWMEPKGGRKYHIVKEMSRAARRAVLTAKSLIGHSR